MARPRKFDPSEKEAREIIAERKRGLLLSQIIQKRNLDISPSTISVWFRRNWPAYNEYLSNHFHRTNKIIELLNEKKLNNTEIAKEAGVSRQRVQQVSKRMKNKG